MSIIWTLLRATAILGGSVVALLTGGIAHADPVPSGPVPGIGDLGSAVASAPQLLQNFGSALGVLPPQTPPAPPPLAGASITVPQPAPAAVAGAPAASTVPGTSGIPGITSVIPGAPAAPARVPSAVPGTTAAAPATGPAQLLPQAQVDVPQMPFLPVPLPQQLSLPGDLASLAPGGLPIPRGIAPAPAAAAALPPSAPAAPTNPLLIPLSALP